MSTHLQWHVLAMLTFGRWHYSNRLFRQRVDGCALSERRRLSRRVCNRYFEAESKQSVCTGSQNEIYSEQAQTNISGRVCLLCFAPRVLAFLGSMSCVLAVRARTLAFGYRSMDCGVTLTFFFRNTWGNAKVISEDTG